MTYRRFRTIKHLVFDFIHRTKGKVDYPSLEREVLQQFPNSAFNPSHWSWYRNQCSKGRFAAHFSTEEKTNMASTMRRGPRGDQLVRQRAAPILRSVRQAIEQAADGDQDLEFKIRRWIFARLQMDEAQPKRKMKKALWELGSRRCRHCGGEFKSLTGLELHRLDSTKGYLLDNCVLVHRACHVDMERGEKS
jgi:hypothetical protein